LSLFPSCSFNWFTYKLPLFFHRIIIYIISYSDLWVHVCRRKLDAVDSNLAHENLTDMQINELFWIEWLHKLCRMLQLEVNKLFWKTCTMYDHNSPYNHFIVNYNAWYKCYKMTCTVFFQLTLNVAAYVVSKLQFYHSYYIDIFEVASSIQLLWLSLSIKNALILRLDVFDT
jgi:hypothetical protein